MEGEVRRRLDSNQHRKEKKRCHQYSSRADKAFRFCLVPQVRSFCGDMHYSKLQ